LKPANVKITKEGRVKVLDFGLAKLAEDTAVSEESVTEIRPLTTEGTLLGTVPYMSPEQLRGKDVDHRSDIFALGILLYELATGQRPFQGETNSDVTSSILRDTPPPVTQLKPEFPRHLGRIVAHCLEKEPEQRYQSAKDVRNELSGLHKEVEAGVSEIGPADAGSGKPEPSGGCGKGLWVGLAAASLVVVALVLILGRGDRALQQRATEIQHADKYRAEGNGHKPILDYVARRAYGYTEGPTQRQIEGEAIEAPSSLAVVIVRVEAKDNNNSRDVADAEKIFNGITITRPAIE
jgi:hypothetical protein